MVLLRIEGLILLTIVISGSLLQIDIPSYYSIVEGEIQIDAGYSNSIEVSCNKGDVVRGGFSAEYSEVDLYVIHSEDYISYGIYNESTFLYHVRQRSYSLQFTSGRDGTWNLIFANNTSTQTISFRFEVWSEEDWNSMSVLQVVFILVVVLLVIAGIFVLILKIRKRNESAKVKQISIDLDD